MLLNINFYRILKDEFVIEYIGEKIRNQVSDIREQRYQKEGFGDCYMFKINENYVIDASFYGN